jgi:sugar O-acyltransferase (sialic acid O-acetyltransferase NeuD family)
MEDYPRAILGAGKQAGHILCLLEWMGLPWRDCLLFDDQCERQKNGARDLPIAGTLENGIEHCRQQQLPAIVAIGSRYACERYLLFQKAERFGVSLVNLIHPSCEIAPTAVIGKNVVMMPKCVVSPGTSIGSLSCFFSNVTMEHDCSVGENVSMGPGCTLSGFVRVGDHCFLGAGVVCAPKVSIGCGTLVGAGAVVVHGMRSGVVCAGNPAKEMREARMGDDVPTQAQLQEFSR